MRRGGTSTALRAFKLGVKPGFISDLFTPGKQLTLAPAIPRPVSSVYSKQSRRDSFYLTNDPGIANHSRTKQFIPAKWTHSMSLGLKTQRITAVSISRVNLLTIALRRSYVLYEMYVAKYVARSAIRSLVKSFARTFHSPNLIASNRDALRSLELYECLRRFDATLPLTRMEIISRRGKKKK